MSDLANILFGSKTTRASPHSGKKRSPYPPAVTRNISEPLPRFRSAVSSPPKTSSPSVTTGSARLIPSIGASPSAFLPNEESRASTPSAPSLRAGAVGGGPFRSRSPLSNRVNLQPRSLFDCWNQPRSLTDKGASGTPMMGFNDSRPPSLPTLTPCSSVSSLNSVKHMPRTPSETPAQLTMTMTARPAPPSERPTEKRVTTSVSTIASSAPLLPYSKSSRLDSMSGSAERGSLEAVKMIPPPMKPPTTPIPPIPSLSSGSRTNLSTPISSKGSETAISSLNSTLAVPDARSTTINTTTSTLMVPPRLNGPPSLRIHVRSASVDVFHDPRNPPSPLTPRSTSFSPSSSPTPTASCAPSASSAATPPSSFAHPYTHSHNLSTTQVAGTWPGHVERKDIQRSPTRTPNATPTVTASGFPLPPTYIPPALPKVVQEAHQIAQSPRQRRIGRPSSFTPAAHGPIDPVDPKMLLFTSRLPPSLSTGPSQKLQRPSTRPSTASSRLQKPKRSINAVTPYESFLPSFDDMEERPGNSNSLPSVKKARNRLAPPPGPPPRMYIVGLS